MLTFVKANNAKHGLTSDPLAVGEQHWFEDYFDYPRDFTEIYKQAKVISTGWTRKKPTDAVRVFDINILETLEQQIHSFWMQVLRDRTLVKTLVEKERPAHISCKGLLPDAANISECRFDIGLFEYTLRDIAGKNKIPVEAAPQDQIAGPAIRQPGLRDIAGAFSARAKAGLRRAALPGNDILLFSKQAKDKLGVNFLKAVCAAGLVPVCVEPGPSPDCLTVWDLSGPAVGTGERLAAYNEVVNKLKSLPESAWSGQFTIDGCNYGPIARDVVHAVISRVLWSQINALLLCKKLFMAKKPLALLVLYDHGINEAPLVSLARNNRIQTITLQHGLVCRDVPGYLPICSDYFASWGRAEMETLVKQGADKEKIKVVGNPGFDCLMSANRDSESTNKPIKVLIATQGVQSSVGWYHGLEATERIIRSLVNLSADPNKYTFTLRLHPNEALSAKGLELAKANDIKISKAVGLKEDFANADVVAVQFSTVGVEAMLAGKPLVSFNWRTHNEIVPYAESGAAVFSNSPRNFLSAVDEALGSLKERRSGINGFLSAHLTDAQSAKRLLDLCIN